MPNTDLEIKNIQFKRGEKEALEARLIASDLGVPQNGEPIYETDTKKLKIGDGITAYAELPYFGSENTGSGNDNLDIPNFIIRDPSTNHILIYDETQNAWINKDLAESESIIYLAEHGLTIKGYDNADQGFMLVKDQQQGLVWVKPLDNTQLTEAVAAAEDARDKANDSAILAGNSALNAEKAEGNATAINRQTMNWVNEKFWWGSLEEYNEHIQKNGLNPGTFYFVTPEK